jgi:hypothetical protein
MAFPTTPILDNFQRANETPLSGGGNWGSPLVNIETAYNLVSHAIIGSSTAVSGIWLPLTLKDAECYYDVIGTPVLNTTQTTILLCVSSALGASFPKCYDINWNATSTSFWNIYRDDGVSTQLLLAGPISDVVSNGDSIGASIINGVITLYHKYGPTGAWIVVATVTDPNPLPPGHIGLDGDNTVPLTNFGGGSPQGGPALISVDDSQTINFFPYPNNTVTVF